MTKADLAKYVTEFSNWVITNHRELLEILLVVSFVITFAKKAVMSAEIPDIPGGWEGLIIAILGLRGVETVTSIRNNKKSNGSDGST